MARLYFYLANLLLVDALSVSCVCVCVNSVNNEHLTYISVPLPSNHFFSKFIEVELLGETYAYFTAFVKFCRTVLFMLLQCNRVFLCVDLES